MDADGLAGAAVIADDIAVLIGEVLATVFLGRIVEELYLIWYTSTADEYTDRVLFIPL